jgi:hypothetical protein
MSAIVTVISPGRLSLITEPLRLRRAGNCAVRSSQQADPLCASVSPTAARVTASTDIARLGKEASSLGADKSSERLPAEPESFDGPFDRYHRTSMPSTLV